MKHQEQPSDANFTFTRKPPPVFTHSFVHVVSLEITLGIKVRTLASVQSFLCLISAPFDFSALYVRVCVRAYISRGGPADCGIIVLISDCVVTGSPEALGSWRYGSCSYPDPSINVYLDVCVRMHVRSCLVLDENGRFSDQGKSDE